MSGSGQGRVQEVAAGRRSHLSLATTYVPHAVTRTLSRASHLALMPVTCVKVSTSCSHVSVSS